MLWRCWLGSRKGIRPVINCWVVGCWRGYLSGDADLHMVQLMPLPLTVSCFSKIQTGLTFLVPTVLGGPGQKAAKHVCVCVCACARACVRACVRACSGNSNWARPYVTKWSGRIWHQMALCGSVGKYIVGTTQTIFTKFPVHVTYGRGAVLFWRLAMSYVLPALWMTSYLGIMVRNRRRKKGDSTSDSTGGQMHLTLRHILKLTQQGAESNRGWSLISMIA